MNSRLRPIPTLVRRELRRAVWLLLALTALLALPHQAQAQTPAGICDRTPQVRDAILIRVARGTACEDVTAAQLAAITEFLTLSRQNITSLKPGDFDGLINLRNLYLGANALTSLPEGVFGGLTNLEHLNLGQNALASLPEGVFDGLVKLEYLGLASNALTALPEGVFRGLPNLWALGLGSNNLTSLPEGVFAGLTNLEHLGLFSNALTTLPYGVFGGLSSLQVLSLNNNGLKALPEDVFDGLANLKTLALSSNALTSLPDGVFGGLANLETLYLIANYNHLSTLPAGVFDRLANLKTLNLSVNGLRALPDGVFDGLANLKTLNLGANDLTALPADMFVGLVSLEELELHSNGLTALPVGVFDGLTNLKTLGFWANELTTLPEGVFDRLANLETLNLARNTLTAVPDGVFDGLSSLQTLDLSYNALTTLPDGVFDGLSSLETLDLSENFLTRVPAAAFDTLLNLQTLDLSYNFLTARAAALLDDLRARAGLAIDLEGNVDARAPKWVPLSVTGDSSNRIDLVIVSEAYTASQMGTFAKDVNAVLDALFSEDPFQEYANYFNVWRVDIPSNESGADRPEQTPPVLRDTAFDASFNPYLNVNSRKVIRAIRGMPAARDTVLVLVNDPAGGGSGGYMAVTSNAGNFVNVAAHELGHTLGGLADEYVFSPRCLLWGDITYRGEPEEANITLETNRSAIKWRHWIDSRTPIPARRTSETAFSEGVPGLYEGARYCAEGIFRPTWTSKMNNSRTPWKQINTEELVRVFYDHVSPIDAWTPSTTQLTLPRGVSHTFAVTPMSPATHEIEMDWSLDGAPIGSGSSLLLDTTAMAVGDHVVTVRVSDETPMVRSDPFDVLSAQQSWTVTILSVDSEPFEIQDRGATSVTSSGTGESFRVGYGRIGADTSSTTPSGIAVFQFRDNEGVLISEAGVPAAEPVRSGRIFAEVNGPVNTGVAIANPNSGSADIRFYFTDTGGARVAEGSFELGGHQHIAKFLSDAPFDGGSAVHGTFTFISSVPVVVIALRGLTNRAGEFLMTTLPVAPLAAPLTPFTRDTANRDTVYFPHFVDGSGWSTQVILVNPTARTITGTVEFLGPGSDTTAAAPVILTLDDGRTGSRFGYSIPARSSQRFITSNPLGSVSVGSVRTIPDTGRRSPSGLVVFSFTAGGKTVSEAGVPALPTGSAFRVPVDAFGTPEHPNSIRTGLAIANTAPTSTTVTLEVTGIDGLTAAPPATLSLPPSGQVARFIDDIFDSLPENFSGVLRVTSTAQVAVVALRLRINERGELKMTTTTPSNETEASTMADRFFPHIVDSGGWTTQFILFSGRAGETPSGTLKIILFPPE